MKFNSGRFWLQFAVFGMASVAVFMAAFLSLLYWQFDSRLARQKLEAAFSAHGRILHVNGSISPVFWPKPGIAANDVTLTEADGSSPFARMRRIELRFAWFPLLQKHYTIERLRLTGLDATITRQVDGSLNIADLLQPQPDQEVDVRLDRLELYDGTLALRDIAQQARIGLSALRIDATDLQSDGDIEFSATTEWGKYRFPVEGETPIRIADDQIELAGLRLQTTGKLPPVQSFQAQLTANTRINLAKSLIAADKVGFTLKTSSPEAGLTLNALSLEISQDGLRIPSLQYAGNLIGSEGKHSLHGTASEFILTGQHASAALARGNYIQSSGPHALTLDFESPLELTTDHLLRAQPAKIQALITTPFLPRGALQSQLTGTVDLSLDSSTLDTTLAGLFDGAELSFSGRQEGFLKPKRTASLALARLDLNRYLPEPDGPLAPLLNSRQKISLGWLTRQDFSGRFVIGELRIGRMTAQQIDADITANRNGIDIPRLSAAIYQGQLEGSAKISNDQVPTLSINQSIHHMNIQPLLVDLFDFSRIEGSGNGHATLNAQGRTFDEWRQTMNGTLEIGLQRGALTGINLVEALKNLPAELSQWGTRTYTSDTQQKTPFQNLSATFAFESGVGRNQNLKLTSPLIDLAGGGKIDIGRNIIDYSLDVRANAREFPRLKDMNVPIKITGAMASPTYALDFNAMIKDKKTESEKQQALKEQLTRPLQALRQ